MNTTNKGIRALTLFHYPATRSARVKWILHETVGESFTTEPLDLYAGVQYSDEFMAKNPNHNVPVLDVEFDDGSHMSMLESAAMVAFLADAYPTNSWRRHRVRHGRAPTTCRCCFSAPPRWT